VSAMRLREASWRLKGFFVSWEQFVVSPACFRTARNVRTNNACHTWQMNENVVSPIQAWSAIAPQVG
jgi:hypothetical protein